MNESIKKDCAVRAFQAFSVTFLAAYILRKIACHALESITLFQIKIRKSHYKFKAVSQFEIVHELK